MNRVPEDYNEQFLAMSNPLFGAGIMIFFLMPRAWSLVKSPLMPDCLGLRDVGNYQWVADGSMRTALIVRQREDHRTYLFQLNVKTFFDDEKAQRHIGKRLVKIQRNRRVKLVRYGDVSAGGHQGKYMLWTRRSKPFLISRERMEATLELFVYCHVTKRVLHLKLSTPKPESMMMDAEKLISVLSSIGCHGSALKSE